jgi:hypothetical protein
VPVGAVTTEQIDQVLADLRRIRSAGTVEELVGRMSDVENRSSYAVPKDTFDEVAIASALVAASMPQREPPLQ